jgi:hypothetical protein
MMPLVYHSGQRAAQEEAGTVRVADKLADWVGPALQFALGADLFVLALPDAGGGLRFEVLSGEAPLVEAEDGADIVLRLPPALAGRVGSPNACGGLAISLAEARRARVNGLLGLRDGRLELRVTEAFTLCRKYFAPSIATDKEVRVGPSRREQMPLDDPWLVSVVARAETSFLASISPDGMPDVAHRGGRPGFLALDPAARSLQWNEYVGDGIFKSAGNMRATGAMALLVPDLASGDGVALHGRGVYETVNPRREARENALVQHKEDYPVQGVVTCAIERAERLTAALHPRTRVDRIRRITCRSAVEEQRPQ